MKKNENLTIVSINEFKSDITNERIVVQPTTVKIFHEAGGIGDSREEISWDVPAEHEF
jgi:hypothetical protein